MINNDLSCYVLTSPLGCKTTLVGFKDSAFGLEFIREFQALPVDVLEFITHKTEEKQPNHLLTHAQTSITQKVSLIKNSLIFDYNCYL